MASPDDEMRGCAVCYPEVKTGFSAPPPQAPPSRRARLEVAHPCGHYAPPGARCAVCVQQEVIREAQRAGAEAEAREVRFGCGHWGTVGRGGMVNGPCRKCKPKGLVKWVRKAKDLL